MDVTGTKLEELVRRCMSDRIVAPADVVAGDRDIETFDEDRAVQFLADDALLLLAEPDRRTENWDLHGETCFTLAPNVYQQWAEIERRAKECAARFIKEFDAKDLAR